MQVPAHIVDLRTVPPIERPDAEALAAEVILEPTTGPRFCRACGSVWEAAWVDCEACAKNFTRQAVLRELAPESRAVNSSVAMYFALLAICASGLIAGYFHIDRPHHGLQIQLWEEAGLTALTLVWAAVSMRSVASPLSSIAAAPWFAVAVGLSLVTFGIATGVIAGFNYLVRPVPETMSRDFLSAGYGWGFIVLCVCVQPAVIEELAFRGVIFAGMSRVLNRWETIFVTALMFMTLHLSPVRFPHTLALGLGAGYLRTRTRSLYPCMAMHFSHNLLCVVAERFHWF